MKNPTAITAESTAATPDAKTSLIVAPKLGVESASRWVEVVEHLAFSAAGVTRSIATRSLGTSSLGAAATSAPPSQRASFLGLGAVQAEAAKPQYRGNHPIGGAPE